MANVQAAYGGTYGNSYRLVMDVAQTSQNTGANTSLLTINVYLARVSSTGGDIYNLSPTGWSANVDGQPYSGSITQGHLSSGGTVSMLSTTKTISHNADGTRSVSFSASHDSGNSPYQTSASLSSSMGLTTINRYAAISSDNRTSITDVGFTFTLVTDVTCDIFGYSLDGGAYQDTSFSGTSKAFTISGLTSGVNHTITGRVRRADSGLYTTGSTRTVTTLTQNNFGGFTEF